MEENRDQPGKTLKNTSGNEDQKQQGQGTYKNIETSVNNPSYYDDDYAARKEDEISEREQETEEEGRVGKS